MQHVCLPIFMQFSGRTIAQEPVPVSVFSGQTVQFLARINLIPEWPGNPKII